MKGKWDALDLEVHRWVSRSKDYLCIPDPAAYKLHSQPVIYTPFKVLQQKLYILKTSDDQWPHYTLVLRKFSFTNTPQSELDLLLRIVRTNLSGAIIEVNSDTAAKLLKCLFWTCLEIIWKSTAKTGMAPHVTTTANQWGVLQKVGAK
jgi:hypothetical protein